MFYTLTNQFLIKKSGGDNEFLYVFLIGSAMYVALHWYLHMEEKDGIMGRLREYLYYLLVLDFVSCLIIYKMTPIKDIDDTGNLEVEEKKEITTDEKKAILQKMQEARKLQQKLVREKESGDKKNDDKKNDDKEQTDVETSAECKKDSKCKIFKSVEPSDNTDNSNYRKKEKSDNHSVVSNSKPKKKIKQDKNTDTDIPIFTQKAPTS